MSKSAIKKFRKNDYSDNDEFRDDPVEREQKHKAKRVERALKTKDISSLIDDEGEELDFVEDNNWKY